MSSKPVLISGATGLVGKRLLQCLQQQGVELRALSRSPRPAADTGPPPATQFYTWDGFTPPTQAVRNTQAIVHLAGEPIFAGIPTRARRLRMRDSRIQSTRNLVNQIAQLPADQRPATLICASAVGIYGDQGENEIDEQSSIFKATPEPMGNTFLAQVCRDWESEAARAEEFGVRVCSLRIGIVLSRAGGALPRMLLPFRLGLGGPFGRGQHWVPWIHLDDLCGLIAFAIQHSELRGPINAVAPEAVRNLELSHTLGRLLNRPTFLPVPPILLRLVLGDLANELLDSRKIKPARAMAAGFQFQFKQLEDALVQELRPRP